MAFDLHLDEEELSSCVACGLCLPHCPTFRATGEEGLSPRGRIDAMRNVQWRGGDADDEFVRFMETCVQCRGLRAGVPERRAVRPPDGGHPRGAGRRPPHGAALAAGRVRRCSTSTGCCSPGRRCWPVAQRLRLVPRRAGLARLPLRRGSRVEPTRRAPDRARLAVHRLRHGRLDARHAPGDGGVDRGGRRVVRRVARRRAAARCTPTPGSATTPAPGRAGDGVDARRRSHRRQLGRAAARR